MSSRRKDTEECTNQFILVREHVLTFTVVITYFIQN